MTNLQQAVNHPIFDKISNYCQENNKECFVVGGYVRDFLLKRKSKDIDILVLGSGIDVAKNIAKKIDEKILDNHKCMLVVDLWWWRWRKFSN